MDIKVKICGITNHEDAFWAGSLGADFIGLNFYKGSKRNISIDTAKEILDKKPPFVEAVGVFVNEPFKETLKVVDRCQLKFVQLHGKESPKFCERLRNRGLKVIKAFRIRSDEDLEQIKPYIGSIDYLLLDAYVEGELGGTGEVFNWELAIKAAEYGVPIFLAGGLTPENVREAISKVKPFAVDVASGVERSPRRKDFQKLREFINAVKSFRGK